MDAYGDHLLTCMRSGLVQTRGKGFEWAWAWVFEEAGARVTRNCLLRDLAIPGISPGDSRSLDFVARGLPLCNGLPVCGDVTVRSVATGAGCPVRGAEETRGSTFALAVKNKH